MSKVVRYRMDCLAFFTVFLCFFAGFFSCEDPFVCGNVLMQEILETGSDGRKNSQSGFVRRDSEEAKRSMTSRERSGERKEKS